jgi:hypothetical protein
MGFEEWWIMEKLEQEAQHYYLFSDYSRNKGKIIDETGSEILIYENTWRGFNVKYHDGKELHLKKNYHHIRETTEVTNEQGNRIGKFQISLRGIMIFITPDEKQLFCIQHIQREYRIRVYHPETDTEIASVKWHFWIETRDDEKRKLEYDIFVFDESYSIFELLSGICYMFKRIRYG